MFRNARRLGKAVVAPLAAPAAVAFASPDARPVACDPHGQLAAGAARGLRSAEAGFVRQSWLRAQKLPERPGASSSGPHAGPRSFPRDTIGLLGVPLVDPEGQNLDGADLGPLAMREAGLMELLHKLGYATEDHGDLDLLAGCRALGLESARGATDPELWRAWQRGGSRRTFAEWRAAEGAAHQKPENRVAREPKLGHPTQLTGGDDAYKYAVKAHLIGPALRNTYEEALRILQKNQVLLSIGDDHSIASSTIAAASEVHPDLCVVRIGAHGEWIDAHDLCVDESRVAVVGIRDINSVEGKLLRDSDVHIYTTRDFDDLGVKSVIESVLQNVDPNRQRPIHLSLDINAIDTAFATGTGTRARAGLREREVHYLLEELALTGRVVSMDLVDVNPGQDTARSARRDPLDLEGMRKCTPTVKRAVQLCLSALGKEIIPKS